MSSHESTQIAGRPGEPFGIGVDDIVIVPLVAIGFVVRRTLRAVLKLLIHIMDWLFPILLQLVRFPLFTLRILGDGFAWLLKAIVRILPVGGTRRAAWREWVGQTWAWLRSKISYKAFEHWLHHVFEDGMAWVFRKCKALTPGQALLVLLGAVLWLPISFGVATAVHAILFAKALVWPAWVQLLHPLATVIAKSKLLVLPVYPAAWPQAKEHPMMQSLIRFWFWLEAHYLARKIEYRYGQIEVAASEAGHGLWRAGSAIGLSQFGNAVLTGLNATAAWVGRLLRAAVSRIVELLSCVPVVGGIVQRYSAHYDVANRGPSEPLSERTRDFFARWSVKFTVEYYEQKEREQAVHRHAGT